MTRFTLLRVALASLALVVLLALSSHTSAHAAVAMTPQSAPYIAPQATCAAVYTVRPGDWLSRIAASYGVPWPELAAANGLANPNLIFPGQRLCIARPAGAGSGGGGQAPHAIYHRAWFANTAIGGECTWHAAQVRSDLDLRWAGDAWQWANTARARGYHVGVVPAVGSVVVFAPGVQGANRYFGHVAIVIAVSGRSFEVSAMAAPYRWVISDSWHTATYSGAVQFIYG